MPYRVAPIFLIRMAGVPFDPIERLATREMSTAAREVLARRSDVAAAVTSVGGFLDSQRDMLSKDLVRAWRRVLRTGAGVPAEPHIDPFNAYRQAVSALAIGENNLDQKLQTELQNARAILLRSAREFLPDYLIFINPETNVRLTAEWSVAEPPPRNKKARAHERHLLLYLQRVSAKNDSLSAFGPEGWGRIDNHLVGLRFSPKPGISQREVFLERWTAHGVAAALNRDPDVRMEVAPRPNPNGRLQDGKFLLPATGDALPLGPQALEALARCNGETPAHSLGVGLEVLEQLAGQNVLRWEVEVPAMQPRAFEILLRDVRGWRDRAVRERWLTLLEPIADLPSQFGNARKTAERIEIMGQAHRRLSQLGAQHSGSNRFLYVATNPLGEECVRETNFVISETMINEVATQAAPWIDLWRDNYAFVASRVAAGLRGIVNKAGAKGQAMPLPAFLKICEEAHLSLTGPGLVALAVMAFQEAKAAFKKRLEPHAHLPEYDLTFEDCHVIRSNFEYSKFDEYTYPSADLQIAAPSVEAIDRGDYKWILAELHPPVALLHHGFYWGCPDDVGLSTALVSTVFGKPSFHFGIFVADFTATTTVRYLDAMDDFTYFVAPQRSSPKWRKVSPADAEVYVDEETGDVCLRKADNREYLGSFARAWVIPLGFHPFQFGMSPHTPRLRCGNVIVQRRAWVVTMDEFPVGNYSGISRDLILAIERLRARRDLPRYVYIRPTEQALRRSGAEGRDKDTKPVFIDLESYLFLEIFQRWLVKAGELEVTEMLPTPDQLWWKESDGRRTCELRTLIIPGS